MDVSAVPETGADPLPPFPAGKCEGGYFHFECVDGTTWTVVLPAAPTTTLQVSVRGPDGLVHEGELDLEVEKQCQRFVRAAVRKLGRPVDARGFAAIQEAVTAHFAPPCVPVPARQDSLAVAQVLAAGDPWMALTDLREESGLVGDAQAWGLGLLTLVSRALPIPLWTVLTGAGALGMIETLAAAMPEEWLVHPTKLTAGGLRSTDLRQRLVVVDAAQALRPETRLELDIQRARGTTFGLLAAAPVPVDLPALMVPLDESAEQTERILAAERQRWAGGQQAVPPFADTLKGLLTQLPVVEVVIPFADRIRFPATRPEHRQELRWLLTATQAMALLHCRHRRQVNGQLFAEESDFHAVLPLVTGILGRVDDGLDDRAHRLLQHLHDSDAEHWTEPGIRQAFPEWTRYATRRALQDLCEQGFIRFEGGGRGRRPVVYYPADDLVTDRQPEIGIADIVENCRNGFDNISPVVTTA